MLKIKVILVDDHGLVVEGIGSLLSAMKDIKVLAICNCGEQALQLIGNNRPDVILMDINMPGMGGVEACKRILHTIPSIKLIGLSGANSASIPQQLRKIGAFGFVTKDMPGEEIGRAIRTVHSGERYFPNEPIINPSDSPFSDLSQREAQVARLILQGYSIPEISEQLSLNSTTVNTYRYRMYTKLGIKNRSDAKLSTLAEQHTFN